MVSVDAKRHKVDGDTQLKDALAALAAAGLVTFLVIWLTHGYIYRWPSTRLTDAGIDAALTRFAWPGFRLMRRLFRSRRRTAGANPAA